MKNRKISRRDYIIKWNRLLVFTMIGSLFFAGQVFAADTTSNKWVLNGSAKVNPNNERTSFAGGGALDWYYPEERYLGKTRDYSVSETSFTMKDHEYDRGEYWNVTFTSSFTKPPSTLIPGETVALPVSLSGGGSVTNGGGWQSGITFDYRLNDNTIEGSQLGINLDFESVSASPSFVVPVANPGGKLTIGAFLRNCAACYVEWEYKVEEAKAEVTPEPVVETPAAEETVVEKVEETEEVEEEEEKIDHPCLGVLTKGEIDEIRSKPGGVTIIEEVRGKVEVLREGKWTIALPYMILEPGEAVRTGPGAEAFFIIKKVLNEGDKPYIPMSIQEREHSEQLIRNRKSEGVEWLWGAMKAITIWGQTDFNKYEQERAFLDENSELCTGLYHETYERERGYIDLIKGGIHMITNGWKNGSIFSVKAGTTVCGIRGSEIMVTYDPESEKVGAYVIEGHMDVIDTVTDNARNLTDNQKLTLEDGVLGEIEPMSQAEWDELAVAEITPLTEVEEVEDVGATDEEISDAPEEKTQTSEDTGEPSENNNSIIFLTILIPVFMVIFVFAYIKKK